MGDHHDVSRLHGARRHHAKVGAGDRGHRELAQPALTADPAAESGARYARTGHLELEVGTHAPPLADQSAVHVEPDGRQVLAERPRSQVPAELLPPTVEVLACVGVDGLFVAAVRGPVADEVPDEPAALAVAHRPGRPHQHRPVDRPLVDPVSLALLYGFGRTCARFTDRTRPSFPTASATHAP